MSDPAGRAVEWVADPSIAWRILLTARTHEPLDPVALAARQSTLHASQGWAAATDVAVDEPDVLRRRLAEVRDEPLVVGLADQHLVVSAFHAYVDGLGLLDVLAALVDSPASSATRGIGDRPPAQSVLRAGLSRLAEVAVAPPARVATVPVTATGGDAYAATSVDGPVRTAALVHAAAAGIVAHNRAAGRSARHVAVAVGAGRPAAPGEPLANRSELIRLRDVDRMAAADVEAALRSAPLSGAGGTGAAGGRVTQVALRILGPRLGSTMLVSHLGEVTTAAASDLAFYPVTAGGTGLSLGAVTHDGRTTLTLRGRGSDWAADGLEGLLAGIAAQLS